MIIDFRKVDKINNLSRKSFYYFETIILFKNFFKRSVKNKPKNKCFYRNDCVFNAANRTECKSCRYSKCLEVGMSYGAIKKGRIPKLQKSKFRSNKTVQDPLLNKNQITEITSNSTVFITNPFKDAKIDSHMNFMIELEKFKEHMLTLNLKYKLVSNNKTMTENCVLDGIKAGLPLALDSLINLAKEIPGLSEIQNTSDFDNLVRNHLFDYLIVNIYF